MFEYPGIGRSLVRECRRRAFVRRHLIDLPCAELPIAGQSGERQFATGYSSTSATRAACPIATCFVFHKFTPICERTVTMTVGAGSPRFARRRTDVLFLLTSLKWLSRLSIKDLFRASFDTWTSLYLQGNPVPSFLELDRRSSSGRCGARENNDCSSCTKKGKEKENPDGDVIRFTRGISRRCFECRASDIHSTPRPGPKTAVQYGVFENVIHPRGLSMTVQWQTTVGP